jgi:hypothetical protein
MCFANPLFSQELKEYIIENFGLIHQGYMSRILNAVKFSIGHDLSDLECGEV